MKWLHKLQGYLYTALMVSVVWASVTNIFFEQVSEANWIEGLPVKVNAVSVVVTLAMALHFFVVHALVFAGDARRYEVWLLIIAGYPYLIIMLPFLNSPLAWKVVEITYAVLVIEFFFPDWPGRLVKAFRGRGTLASI